MRTITFYSYKGGVGRTLAAVNFAVYLAKLGQKTVLIDFDLDAPGSDSKFPDIDLPADQDGILDYILKYQDTKSDPGSVEQICIQVPVGSLESVSPLWLIPAGNYLSPEYPRKLSKLDWDLIFSEGYRGVELFQNFLTRIEKELEPDIVIVDSRTGIGEIAGVCTQQLADEVVMLSSLSGESIKMTKHIRQLILQSKIAHELGKSIDVKVVVSRVPKPDNLDRLKKRCCELFEVDETKLFFLFSCPTLEQEEFLAVDAATKAEELVSNYVQLFYGLDVELASEGIRSAIEQTAHNLLLTPSTSPEESETRILELAALYPHPEVYRVAMRFYHLTKDIGKTKTFGWKLLDSIPDNEEAQRTLANIYMSSWLEEEDLRNVVRVLKPLWQKRKLKPEEALRYANFLERTEQYLESFDVAFALCNENQIDDDTLLQARAIAVRNALRSGKRDIAMDLAARIPEEELSGASAALVLELREKDGDVEGAFEMAKRFLRRRIDLAVLQQVSHIARGLGRIEELEEAVKASAEFRDYISGRRYSSPQVIEELRHLGLHELADELRRLSRSAMDE